jgi:hypothetical protein
MKENSFTMYKIQLWIFYKNLKRQKKKKKKKKLLLFINGFSFLTIHESICYLCCDWLGDLLFFFLFIYSYINTVESSQGLALSAGSHFIILLV